MKPNITLSSKHMTIIIWCIILPPVRFLYRLQAILATYGIPTQTSKQIESVTLGDAGETLMKVSSISKHANSIQFRNI